MKAIYFTEHGSIDVLRYGDIPEPAAKPGEALVAVRYAGLNHLDIWVRRGWKGLSLTMPHVTGSDFIGTIKSINDTTGDFAVGDTVLINPGYNLRRDEWTRRGEHSVSPGYRVLGEHRAGGLAQYVSVPISCLHKVPANAPAEALAAMPVVAQTCWRMLKTAARVSSGDHILIVGSGGGVNSLSLQLCKSFGCDTIVICGNGDKAAKAKALGATNTIDRTQYEQWHRNVLEITDGRGVDFVIDNVGAESFSKSLKSLRFGGSLLTVGNTSGPEFTLDNRMIFGKQLQIVGSTMGSPSDFESAIEYLCKHAIYPTIDCVAPLAEGINQIKRIEEGKQFGKIVLSID